LIASAFLWNKKIAELAEVIGANLAKLDNEDTFVLRDALWRYGVLLFRKQNHVTSQDLIALVRRLNPDSKIDCNPTVVQAKKTSKSKPLEWKIEGNFVKGSFPQITCMQCLESLPGRAIHSLEYDGYKLSVPNGSTLFVSAYKAYDLLTLTQKEKAEQMQVCYSDSKTKEVSSTLQLVWAHPTTKRKALMGSSESLDHLQLKDRSCSMEESQTFLAEFTKSAINPSYVYVHDWKPGDLVIWDNVGIWYSLTGGADSPKKLQMVVS